MNKYDLIAWLDDLPHDADVRIAEDGTSLEVVGHADLYLDMDLMADVEDAQVGRAAVTDSTDVSLPLVVTLVGIQVANL